MKLYTYFTYTITIYYFFNNKIKKMSSKNIFPLFTECGIIIIKKGNK